MDSNNGVTDQRDSCTIVPAGGKVERTEKVVSGKVRLNGCSLISLKHY